MSYKKDDAFLWEVSRALIKYANANKGANCTAAMINSGAASYLGRKNLSPYCISDFVPTDNPNKKYVLTENAKLYRWNKRNDYTIL